MAKKHLGDIDIDGNIISVENIVFNPSPTPLTGEGSVYYDNVNKSLAVKNNEIDVTLQVGQENWIRVYNNSGSTILNGKVVYTTGKEDVEDRLTIGLAQADSINTSKVLGFATHDIETATFGWVTQFGYVNDLDTSSFTDGEAIWLSDTVAGDLTNVEPQAPNSSVFLGYVVDSHATTGNVFITTLGNTSGSTLAGDATQVVTLARKGSAGTINKGQPVYITGYNIGASAVEIELADSSVIGTMPAIGIANDSITNSANGNVAISGRVANIDTSSFSVNDTLYVSETAGTLTATKPQGTALVQAVAKVLRVHATNGVIEVVGAGRINDLPNLPLDKVWMGDANGVPQETTLTISNISDITASSTEINLLDLSGLTVGWVLSADTATTASWKAPAAGGGNVTKVGTPLNDQIGVWTGDGTLEGDANLTFTVPVQAILSIGQALDTRGELILHSEGTGVTTGGRIQFRLSADYDTTINTYFLQAVEDDFHIEKTGGIDILKYNQGTTRWSMEDYGGGTLTGTATFMLAVDASGNIIEEALPSGGGDVTKVGTPVDNQIGVWTGDGTIEGDTGLVYISNVLSIGLEGSGFGNLSLFGDPTTSNQGGRIKIHTADDFDTTITQYEIEAWEDDFRITADGVVILTYDGGLSTWKTSTNGIIETRDFIATRSIAIGEDDVNGGNLSIFAPVSGSPGSDIKLYVSGAFDTVIDYYEIEVDQDDFAIRKSDGGSPILSFAGGASTLSLGYATTVPDHGTASIDEVVNVCYGTSATPPTASTTTEGALYIQYTA